MEGRSPGRGMPHTGGELQNGQAARSLCPRKRLRCSGSSGYWPAAASGCCPDAEPLRNPSRHNALNKALKVSLQGQEIPAFTIHDLRRTASTLLHENGWVSDVAEKALNHTISGVRGVYNRAQYAEQRKEMLQFWADYIDKYAPAADLLISPVDLERTRPALALRRVA